MSAQPAENTFADKALDAAGKGISAIGTGMSKATNFAADKISKTSGRTILKVMKIANIVFALLLFLCYPVGWLNSTPLTFSGVFLSIYSIVFAIILIVFEMNIPKIQPFVRKQFGFMFTFSGRTFFILFISSMAFGGEFWFNYLAGIVGIVDALFNCFVTWKHPAFKKGGEYYKETLESLATKPAVSSEMPATAAYQAPAASAIPQSNPFTDNDDDIPQAKAPKSTYVPAAKPVVPSASTAPSDNPFDDDF
ncbi:hypothetical protein WA158_007028 [Blastocystis sp. Blastoise]